MEPVLVFAMGKYAAELPTERRYCRNHMWCQEQSAGVWRCGFSAYAIRLMRDVYFLDWCVDAGTGLAAKQAIGNIETSKATSDLFAPFAGTLTTFNAAVLNDPAGINVEPYGSGWLFEIAGTAVGSMDAQAYHDFLAAGWENTQRILKGQV
jgi:glycine cleavage system H protein